MKYVIGFLTFITLFTFYNLKSTRVDLKEGSSCQKFNAFMYLVKEKHVSHLFDDERYSVPHLSKGIKVELLNILDPLHILYTKDEVKDHLSRKTSFDNEICEQLGPIAKGYLKRLEKGKFLLNEILSEDPQVLLSELQSFPHNHKIDPEEWPQTESWVRYRIYYWLSQYLQENKSQVQSQIQDLLVTKRQILRFVEQQKSDFYNQFDEWTYKALLQYLDSHSDFFPVKNFSKVTNQLQSSFVGVGVVVREVFEGYKVLELVEGGPAKNERLLKLGDIIVSADGQSLVGLDVDEIGQYLRGPEGSRVNLEILRKGKKHRIDSLRGPVRNLRSHVYSSVQKIKSKKIGQIKIEQFYSSSNGVAGVKEDFFQELKQLKKQNIKGLIIDLRGNLGGVLTEVVDIVGLFLKTGPVVLEYGTNSDSVKFYSDTDGVSEFDLPLVVLIDEYSASASEILSGSLKSLNRAIVVGASQSFGKGTIQSVGGVENVIGQDLVPGGMKLTTGYYYLPNGQSVQYEGVKPNVVFHEVPLKVKAPSSSSLVQVERPLLERDYRNSLSQPPNIEVDLNGYQKWMEESQYQNLSLYLRSEYMSREILRQNPKDDIKKAALVLSDFIQFKANPQVAKR